jgi:RNA polymerase sigma-70 factor (ECF subfamily)
MDTRAVHRALLECSCLSYFRAAILPWRGEAIHPAHQARTSIERDRRLSTAAHNQVLNDGALIAAVRSGNQEAMAQLYDRYSAVVYSVALRVLGETGAAEDVLQEIFMQLWRTPGAFDASRGNLAPWLAVITRNRAVDTLRKRRPQTEITETIVSVEPDLASQTDRGRVTEKVRSVLKDMPGPQRQALEMAYFEGYSHSEISEKTGEPLGTIKTRIRTGLMLLRKAVEAK